MRTRRIAGTDRDTERRSGLSDPRLPACDGSETPSQPSSSVAGPPRRGPGAWVAPHLCRIAAESTGGSVLAGRAVTLVVADDAHDGAGLIGAFVAQLMRLEVGEADGVARAQVVLAEAHPEGQLAGQDDE